MTFFVTLILWGTHLAFHRKWIFPLRASSVNVTKSAENCGFGHIYWRNPKWKTSFFVQCWSSESLQRRKTFSQKIFSFKKVLLKLSQNSQQNTCVRVSFLMKACNFIIKETLAQVFFYEFCKIINNIFFTEHLRTTASGL